MARASGRSAGLLLIALALTAAPASGAVPRLVIAVDSSASMGGYASGGGCYAKLWFDVIDGLMGDLDVKGIDSYRLQDDLRPGLPLAELPRWADARKYVGRNTNIVGFLQDPRIFGPQATAPVLLVSDLEHDAPAGGADCLGRGSVRCVSERLASLVARGWHVGIVGFPATFRGTRYFPEHRPDGTVADLPKFVKGAVPVYIMVFARDAGELKQIVSVLAERLHRCTSGVRSMLLTEVQVPTVTASLQQALAEIPQVKAEIGGPCSGKPRGAIALALYDLTGNQAQLDVERDAWPACLTLPLVVERTTGVDQTTWTVGFKVTGLAQGEAVAAIPSLVLDTGQHSVRSALDLWLPETLLRRGKKGKATPVNLVMTFRPETTTVPWPDWSYSEVGDKGYETRTYRTAEILREAVRSATDLAVTRAGEETLLTIKFRN